MAYYARAVAPYTLGLQTALVKFRKSPLSDPRKTKFSEPIGAKTDTPDYIVDVFQGARLSSLILVTSPHKGEVKLLARRANFLLLLLVSRIHAEPALDPYTSTSAV